MSSKSTTNKTDYSRGSSVRSRKVARVVAQTPIDAKLHVDFEQSEQRFDYSSSVNASVSDVPSSTVSSYLQKMQRGGLIQPFGCLFAIEEQSFSILAYSENAAEMLDLSPHAVPTMEQQEVLSFGTDVRRLFRPSGAAALQKAANFGDINVLNPILVHSKISGKPFYAVLHRIDIGLVIDLEPVNPSDLPVTAAGALKSYKLAAKSISRLQSLTSGDVSLLCDVVVREVKELTGYDRVMVYKFHEDEHGEVIAECCRPDLEPYLGLHYPATDIPQASRFLFMKNKVRMICDCLARPVKVLHDKALAQPLSLAGSTLRSPHGCHAQYMASMGSIASLAMSVTINEDDETERDHPRTRKLWGLVVCHHTSPRFVPFPLRYACEFLIQVFGVQINKEVELAAQFVERNILRTQTLLCDMLLRDAPLGIVTRSPNVMDLVRCDGAALYYRRKCWMLGITPTQAQIKDIVEWLMESHGGSTGLSTDSLAEAGYPKASILGNAVCGMAAVKLTSTDFLFWFRSHTAREIKWGGAKHDPVARDDGRKMHPRSSFKAFLEVVDRRSVSWEDVEMDAIHSLQLILRGSLQDEITDGSKMITIVPAVDAIQRVDELQIVTSEMVRIIETASIPILAVDASGCINGWNIKLAELTGLDLQSALGRPLTDLVVDDSVHAIRKTLFSALQGMEEKNVEIRLKKLGDHENSAPIILVANACCNRDTKENIVGVCFVGQDITGEIMILNKYNRLQGDYVGIMRNPCPLIPPIFMMDDQGRCVEWNNAMVKLSGLRREQALGQMLLGEVFTVHSSFGFQVKDHDTLTRIRILVNTVIAGRDAEKLVFGYFDQQHRYAEALISASARTDSEGRITGVLCFLHVASPELQKAMQVQRIAEQAAANTQTKLTYIRGEIRNPLNGIKFVQNLMKSLDLNEEQNRLLKISEFCHNQLAKIIGDTDIQGIEESYVEMNSDEFSLAEALEVVRNQVVTMSQEREVQMIFDSPSEISEMCLYGDRLRLQQVLSDFLAAALLFTPPFEGSSVLFKLVPRKESIGKQMHVLHLEFWICHPSPGIPEELIQEMFHYSHNVSREGLGLYMSQKLVKNMNGSVQYLRRAESASFIVAIEFPVVVHKGSTQPD